MGRKNHNERRKFTLSTTVGDVDLLAVISGIATFDRLLEHAAHYTFAGTSVRMLTLSGLSITKATAGRPKDLLVLPEIELMREAEERRKQRGWGSDD